MIRLELEYKANKMEKICNDSSYARRIYGDDMAVLIRHRLNEIEAAASIDFMLKFQIGKCHELQGDRKGEYALYLVHPFRLIVKKGNIENTCIICKIEDYH